MNREKRGSPISATKSMQKEKYDDITRDDWKIKYKSREHCSPDFFGSQFIIMRVSDPLFSESLTVGQQCFLV